jgi:sugar phosphate isomerase/epimerase
MIPATPKLSRFSVLEYPGMGTRPVEVVGGLTSNGLGGVGLSWYRPSGLRLADAHTAVVSSTLQVTFIWPEIVSLLPIDDGTTSDPYARVEAIAASLSVARHWGAMGVGLVTGPARTGREKHDIAWCSQALATLAEEARLLSLDLALEPVHRSLVHRYSFLSDLEDGARFLDDTQARNIGLIADSWHLEGTNLRAQVGAYADRVFHAHLSDGPGVGPRLEYDRLLPGGGDGASVALVRALETNGYNGFYEVEVLATSDAPSAVTLDESVTAAREVVNSLARDGL